MAERFLKLKVQQAARGMRLDRYLATLEELPSRSQFEACGLRAVWEGFELKYSYRLRGGEILEVSWNEPEEIDLQPVPMELKILYEDEDTLVIDKPRGVAVHPGSDRSSPTLVHGVLARLSDEREGWETPLRPGVVHRLDKETTGVLLFARNARALEYYSRQFHDRQVAKVYLAVVKGSPTADGGVVDKAIGRDVFQRKRFRAVNKGGRKALTRWRVLERAPEHSLLWVEPVTGRTHQIRVHLTHLGCPIVGDTLYARKTSGPLLLHAYRLKLRLTDGREAMFESPPPDDFRRAVEELGFSPEWEARLAEAKDWSSSRPAGSSEVPRRGRSSNPPEDP